MSRVIYALLEGDDDERFINKIIRPELEKKNIRVKVFKYAHMTRVELERFVNVLNKSNTAYIFLADMDQPICYTKKKEWIKSKKVKKVDATKIAIVKVEIESWYLAGLDRQSAMSLKILHCNNTENKSKEDFNKICEKYTSRIDCMTDILQKFSLDVAKVQNESFKYFCDKFI